MISKLSKFFIILSLGLLVAVSFISMKIHDEKVTLQGVKGDIARYNGILAEKDKKAAEEKKKAEQTVKAETPVPTPRATPRVVVIRTPIIITRSVEAPASSVQGDTKPKSGSQPVKKVVGEDSEHEVDD